MYMRKQEKTEFVIGGNYLLQVPTIMIHENKKNQSSTIYNYNWSKQ